MYSIEEMIETFTKHSAIHKEKWEYTKNKWVEDHPDEVIPEFYLDEFSLPDALLHICKEIQSLKQ